MSERDATDALATVLAAGALVLQALLAALALLALAALASPRARRWLAEARDTLLGGELWIAWAIALVATLGSLYFSEVSDFIPCRLCWFQRIAMYPLVVVLLGAALRRDVRGAFLYAGALPLVGMAIAGYHLWVEANPESETPGCKAGAPCSTKWIDEFGYVTMPMLAMTAFATIFALLWLAWSRRRD